MANEDYYATLGVSKSATEDEIKKACLKMLPSYQIPTHIELVDDIPKNASGKVVRIGHSNKQKTK